MTIFKTGILISVCTLVLYRRDKIFEENANTFKRYKDF